MQINNKKEVLLSRICVIITCAVLVGLVHFLAKQGQMAYMGHDFRNLAEIIIFGSSVLFLIYGNFLYQWCRIGYYKRKDNLQPASRNLIEQLYRETSSSLTILVPSYKEEREVIWQTMLSAALTEYTKKSVVLLIDDPYQPNTLQDIRKLNETRDIPVALQELFNSPAAKYRAELDAFRARLSEGNLDSTAELARLAELYHQVSIWLDELAAEFIKGRDTADLLHTDAFFLKDIIQAPCLQHAAFSEELRESIRSKNLPDTNFLHCHFVRLAGLFDVTFSSFERKKYRNLSHEANKAMNLNSYIGLMGKGWKEVDAAEGLLLQETSDNADFVIADTDYVLTLDADSLVLSDYVVKLISILEHPDNNRLAVIQTPYSAIPGCPNLLERMAGATTDIQFITHQGFTHWNATFWVGANALIRRTALNDIKQTRIENGFTIPLFIQDRTVIEDTESSIDLICKGWKLYNYPERLAYSATPPDFGSLLIQRRRWANGGLLILPKLLGYVARAPKNTALLKEFLIRFHYLVSLTGVSAATLVLFFYPFGDMFANIWVPLSALPYFMLYARDLRIAGYKYMDVVRIYALNLILIPVVLGGVLKSIEQGITGKHIPFGRTPKISGRTAVPAIYCFVELALPAVFLASFCIDIWEQRWSHASFALINGLFFSYALIQMIGVKDTVSDLFSSFRGKKTSSAHSAQIITIPAAQENDNFPAAELENIAQSKN